MEKHEREEILGITAKRKEQEEKNKAAPPPEKVSYTKFLEPTDEYLHRHLTNINEDFCYVFVHDDDTNELYEYKNQDIGTSNSITSLYSTFPNIHFGNSSWYHNTSHIELYLYCSNARSSQTDKIYPNEDL